MTTAIKTRSETISDKKQYDINGVTVMMTDAQATRWNDGEFSDDDCRSTMVEVPARESLSSHVRRDGEIIMHPPRITRPPHCITMLEALDGPDFTHCLEGYPAAHTQGAKR